MSDSAVIAIVVGATIAAVFWAVAFAIKWEAKHSKPNVKIRRTTLPQYELRTMPPPQEAKQEPTQDS